MKNLTLLFCTLFCTVVSAQSNLLEPKESPKSMVNHQLGISTITVDYHSPAVKERKIWGDVVPYNQLWRCGANENTIVSFDCDVLIEGQPLPAGKYGLHMLPTEDKWTLIFSKNYTSWGSFFYNKSEDALRVDVLPRKHPFTEWLNYGFTNKQDSLVTLSLTWENLEIPMQISANVKEIVFTNMQKQLRSLPGFSWQGWYNAANYCYTNNYNLPKALQMVETANKTQPNNFSILSLKANLMKKLGNVTEGEKLMTESLPYATENQLNNYGYQLIAQEKMKEAIEIFKLTATRFPNSWNAHDSLGEALEKQGNKKEALKAYETALKNSPPDNQKTRLEEIIKKLKG